MLGSRLYLVAALPWLILSPMNLIKLLLNTVSPTAHLWVRRLAIPAWANRPAKRALRGTPTAPW